MTWKGGWGGIFKIEECQVRVCELGQGRLNNLWNIREPNLSLVSYRYDTYERHVCAQPVTRVFQSGNKIIYFVENNVTITRVSRFHF